MLPAGRRLIFAIFFNAIVVAKIVHLYVIAHSFPLAAFLVCLPVFLIPDLLVLCFVWLLVQHRRGQFSLLSGLAAFLISIPTYVAAAVLVSFFCETGGEISWADAASVAFDAGARKVASSGTGNALLACTAIFVVAFFIQDLIQRAVGEVLFHTRLQLDLMLQHILGKSFSIKLAEQNNLLLLLPTADKHGAGLDCSNELCDRHWPRRRASCSCSPGYLTVRHLICWYLVMAQLLGCLVCVFILEPHRPYGHASATLPLSLLSVLGLGTVFVTNTPDVTWPLPDLVTRPKWELPDGYFKGWAPGTDNEFISKYKSRVPEWLPQSPPSGFYRWEPQSKSTSGNTTDLEDAESPDSAPEDRKFYNPVNDPLKINNLNQDMLPALKKSLGLDSVNIRHVVLLQMESMRQELFPLQNDSNFHRMVMQSHDHSEYDDVNHQLARLCVNTERVTGISGNFQTSDGQPISPESSEWHDRTEAGFGGLNILGTHTTCSASIKSLGAIHCGAWPLPVDWCEESKLQSYQPCLPQIFKLFNMGKGAASNSSDYREHRWHSAFFQSIADEFDDQKDMDDMIGFELIVTRKQVDDQIAKGEAHEEEINYFGYPETAIKSHIKDYIKTAIESNQRMFLSHFTSTTHHPWGTPKWFEKTEYMGRKRAGLTTSHEDMNDYLNTIRWNDAWLGQVMQLLDDFGVSNETLVVFVGDHGQGFKEDAKVSGTYQNGHISNFRVPLTFRHPRIPRIQLNVNSSSINVLPTVLDLLISSGSLNAHDTNAASDIIQDYEGQSLIRPFKSTSRGRRAWNFGVVNPGGRFLAVTSADLPWRLVLPWDDSAEYVFTNLAKDPLELDPISNWSLEGLVSDVEQDVGMEAAKWVQEAESVANWWGPERKRLWQYH